ncbi:hypothetical protein ACMYM8_23080, partial [Salmonella enterica subsp. enterica serovar Enteritidis]
MLDQFLKLFERFVVAHELIAANSAKQTVYQLKSDITTVNKELIEKELPVEGEDVVDTKPTAKRKPRKAKVEESTPEPEDEIDYQSLRNQIQAIDDVISEGPSDAAC